MICHRELSMRSSLFQDETKVCLIFALAPKFFFKSAQTWDGNRSMKNSMCEPMWEHWSSMFINKTVSNALFASKKVFISGKRNTCLFFGPQKNKGFFLKIFLCPKNFILCRSKASMASKKHSEAEGPGCTFIRAKNSFLFKTPSIICAQNPVFPPIPWFRFLVYILWPPRWLIDWFTTHNPAFESHSV